MLRPAELAVLVNTLSVAIGSAGFTPEELAVIAAVLTQIGDTLTTMAAQRELTDRN